MKIYIHTSSIHNPIKISVDQHKPAEVEDLQEVKSSSEEFGDAGYIDDLVSKLREEVQDVDSLDTEISGENLLLRVGAFGKVYEFTVPYSDLTFDPSNLEHDVNYVLDAINETLE